MMNTLGKIINLPIIREGVQLFNLANVGYFSIFFGIYFWICATSWMSGFHTIQTFKTQGFNFTHYQYKVTPNRCGSFMIDENYNVITHLEVYQGKNISCIDPQDYRKLVHDAKWSMRGIHNNAEVAIGFLIIFALLSVGVFGMSTNNKKVVKTMSIMFWTLLSVTMLFGIFFNYRSGMVVYDGFEVQVTPYVVSPDGKYLRSTIFGQINYFGHGIQYEVRNLEEIKR